MPAPTTTTSASRGALTRSASTAVLGVTRQVARGVHHALALLERHHPIAERGARAVAGERGEHVVHGADGCALQVGWNDHDLIAERFEPSDGKQPASCRPGTC